jgi:hypothetical protein
MSNKKKQEVKCPLNDNQKKTIKEIADTVEKHKEIVRKFSPFHL